MMDSENVGLRSIDEVDKPPEDQHVELRDIVLSYVSIVFHFIDLYIDIKLSLHYFLTEHYVYFGLTAMFLFIPALISTAFSIRMYYMDGETKNLSSRAIRWKIVCMLVLIFQLAPILRHHQSLQIARKCRKAEAEGDVQKQKEYFQLYLKEDSDLVLLRIIECFLEAAPQQVLQITILLLDYDHLSKSIELYHNFASIVSSFISMGLALASYARCIRYPQENKLNISWGGTVLQFLWHFLITLSRILAISIIASVYPLYTCFAIILHWIIMTIWIMVTEKWYFCTNSCLNFLLQQTIGLVFIFTFVSLSDGPTCLKYTFYYSLLFLENVIATGIWIWKTHLYLSGVFYFYPMIGLTIIPYLLGIIFMIIYYKYFHPNVLNRKNKNPQVRYGNRNGISIALTGTL